MDDWQWRAWVGRPGGGTLGAAFLVDATRLLTCAHTVHGMDEARVGFPGLGEDLPARVIPCGGWRRAGDHGDVAVLELKEPVPYTPARLAGPEELHAGAIVGREFTACGFPRHSRDDERYARLTTSPHQRMRREWWELKTVPGYRLEEGYSGSAVYDELTGTVVGMVTNADFRDGDRAEFGWMLPVSRIRRYWEELDDLLPLGWLTGPARRELRELLDGVAFTGPLGSALGAVTGRPPVEAPRTAWESVRDVAEGWPEDRLVRYLGALGPHLPADRRPRLAAWSRRHLASAVPAPAGAPERAEPASVIVRLERATFDNAFDVTVHTWIDGAEGPSRRTERVPERRVRAAVEEGVERSLHAVVGRRGEWMIEFAVPEGWLGRPFEEWHVDRRNRIPMRRYPVVVRDVERLRPYSIRHDQAWRRWRLLRERGRSEPRPVDCAAPRKGTAFQDWLEANDDYCVLVYGSRPVRSWLTAALNNGVPVMLWTRTACDAPGHDHCRGNLRDLAGAVADAPPGDLPRIAMALRRKALAAPKDRPHCGRNLTLLWDDPSRLPDPPLGMEV
ncbi:VMAP-C domain-containing protein [Actinomadura fibrosa]|uniref:Trypsin-like peptidase domain-containing protein n=1 Tax=Actinomadura fibrosa TaxID=111802 RepID=A0ABW2XCA4_9ACTN|nr:trypsin-like peptidase domain-containing protein [Actinomadura fibrosa]